MRFPPWAIEALRNGVTDVARKASDAETIAKVREQAAELFRDLPENTSRGLDAILKTATETAKEAVDQGREAVMKWADRNTTISSPVWNASGTLFHPAGSGLAVAEHILEAGFELLRGNQTHEQTRQRIDRALSASLQRIGLSIAVANNLDAAIQSVSALGTERDFVIHRSQSIRLPSGLPLPDSLRSASVVECGGVQSFDVRDFDEFDKACVVLADDGTSEVTAIDFDSRDIISIAVLPLGTVKDRFDHVPSAEVLLRNGIDVVVFPGGPMTGGVKCGLLVGKSSLIDIVVASKQWNALAGSDATAAMTLAALVEPDPTPLEQLIDTAADNLRSRAERMATRLTAEESIAACQISDDSASLVQGARWTFPSRQLCLRHGSHSADGWASRLSKREPSLLVSVRDDHLVVDLRWVHPSMDSQIADALSE